VLGVDDDDDVFTYIDSSEVADSAMPYGENNPAPKNLKVEVNTLLASFVDLWVHIDELVVHVLFQGVCEQAGPARPKCVIEGLKPICEENLT